MSTFWNDNANFPTRKGKLSVKISNLSKEQWFHFVITFCRIFCSMLACKQKLLDIFSIIEMVLNYHFSKWNINSYFSVENGVDNWDTVQRLELKSPFYMIPWLLEFWRICHLICPLLEWFLLKVMTFAETFFIYNI